jgi:hypothetical protein
MFLSLLSLVIKLSFHRLSVRTGPGFLISRFYMRKLAIFSLNAVSLSKEPTRGPWHWLSSLLIKLGIVAHEHLLYCLLSSHWIHHLLHLWRQVAWLNGIFEHGEHLLGRLIVFFWDSNVMTVQAVGPFVTLTYFEKVAWSFLLKISLHFIIVKSRRSSSSSLKS